MTKVAIQGEDFLVEGKLTYAGRVWNGQRIEGLLLNSRMVQATFDDLNPETRERWVYPDTGRWDPERNLSEFIANVPAYRQHGLLAATLNFQGGSPEGYSRVQPWENTGFAPDGALRPDFADRMRRAIDALDANGMVAIVGLFYQGQDERLADEAAVLRAVDAAVEFLHGRPNVLVEINNECDTRYEHPILQPERVHELIARVRQRGLLASTSYRGRGAIPSSAVATEADFILIHGNGTTDPDLIADQVERTRAVPGYHGQPIVFNEDDHFDFDKPWNNFTAAISRRASWGYFDPGSGAGGAGARGDYENGYQLVPVNWGINTERKREFFGLAKEVTGACESPLGS